MGARRASAASRCRCRPRSTRCRRAAGFGSRRVINGRPRSPHGGTDFGARRGNAGARRGRRRGGAGRRPLLLRPQRLPRPRGRPDHDVHPPLARVDVSRGSSCAAGRRSARLAARAARPGRTCTSACAGAPRASTRGCCSATPGGFRRSSKIAPHGLRLGHRPAAAAVDPPQADADRARDERRRRDPGLRDLPRLGLRGLPRADGHGPRHHRRGPRPARLPGAGGRQLARPQGRAGARRLRADRRLAAGPPGDRAVGDLRLVRPGGGRAPAQHPAPAPGPGLLGATAGTRSPTRGSSSIGASPTPTAASSAPSSCAPARTSSAGGSAATSRSWPG